MRNRSSIILQFEKDSYFKGMMLANVRQWAAPKGGYPKDATDYLST
jgi:hypothetical protein